MTAALRVTTGYLEGSLLILPRDHSVTVGCSLERDFILFGADVEKIHCRISPSEDGGHVIESVRDAPVLFKSTPIHQLQLQDGDPIRIGEHGFTYLADVHHASENGLGDESSADGDEGSLLEEDVLNELGVRTIDRRLLARKRLENYQIIRKVQMTDLDVTYLALDKARKRRVSVRIFKTEHSNNVAMIRRFLTRAMVRLTLTQKAFSQVHTIGNLFGSCFVVMEYVEGGVKLERFLREKTPLKPLDALRFVAAFVDVMTIARERKLLVARRKPSGIYVDKHRRIKVSQLDLSVALEESIAATEAFLDFRTKHFRSEALVVQAEHVKLDRREREPDSLKNLPDSSVDIMWLGRLYFQVLTGKGFDSEAGVQAIVDGYGRPLPVANRAGEESDTNTVKLVRKGALARVPRDQLTLLARMVTSDPRKRFPGLAELREQVEGLLAEV